MPSLLMRNGSAVIRLILFQNGNKFRNQTFITVVQLDIATVQDSQLRKEICVIIQLLNHFGKKQTHVNLKINKS